MKFLTLLVFIASSNAFFFGRSGTTTTTTTTPSPTTTIPTTTTTTTTDSTNNNDDDNNNKDKNFKSNNAHNCHIILETSYETKLQDQCSTTFAKVCKPVYDTKCSTS